MKDVEIEKLEQVLLALEPPPGMDAARMLDAADGGSGVDVRDAKIVDLAKRNRQLTMQVSKAKRAVAEARRKSQEAELRADQAAASAAAAEAASLAPPGWGRGGGVSVATGPLSPGGMTAVTGATGVSTSDLRQAKHHVRSLRARVEGLQHKLEAAQATSKAARRALAAELGPGAELDAVLAAAGLTAESATSGPGTVGPDQSDGASVATASASVATMAAGRWRGRAQRIVKLRSRVAELERALAEGGSAGANAAGVGTAGRFEEGRGVDEQARAVLGAMERQRQQAAEEVSGAMLALCECRCSISVSHFLMRCHPMRLTGVDLCCRTARVRVRTNDPLQLAEALDAEQASHRSTRQKLDAARARAQGLQREAASLREGVKTLVGKSDVDDKLVEQLRAERLELQQKLAGERRMASDAGSPARTVFAGGRGSAATSVAGMSAAQIGAASTMLNDAGFGRLEGGGSPHTASSATAGRAASVIAGREGDPGRLAAEAQRVSRLAEGQARRLAAQDVVIADLRAQLATLQRAARSAGGREGDGVSLPAAPGSRTPSREGAGHGQGGSAGAGSAGVRAMAAMEVRAAEAERAATTAAEELGSVKDALSRSEARCGVLERQTDQYVAKFSALERRCRELEARMGTAPPATDAVSIAAQLATSENERRALRSNMTAALGVRDAEIARLRERCETLLAHVAAQAARVAGVLKEGQSEHTGADADEMERLRSGNALLRQEVASLRRRLQSMQG